MQAYKIMHGLWGMGQMMFTKYWWWWTDVDVHNTRDVLFHLCANTDPQRDTLLSRGPADVLDHATSEIGVAASWAWTPRGSSRAKVSTVLALLIKMDPGCGRGSMRSSAAPGEAAGRPSAKRDSGGSLTAIR